MQLAGRGMASRKCIRRRLPRRRRLRLLRPVHQAVGSKKDARQTLHSPLHNCLQRKSAAPTATKNRLVVTGHSRGVQNATSIEDLCREPPAQIKFVVRRWVWWQQATRPCCDRTRGSCCEAISSRFAMSSRAAAGLNYFEVRSAPLAV